MSEFIIRTEKFKFGILDKVPVVGADECILLYRKERGENGSMVIDPYTKPLSADIRHGRYNMKVTFTMKEKTSSQTSNLAMADCDFYFHAQITVTYQLKNVKEYYFEDNQESEKIMNGALKKCFNKNDEKWGIREGNELEKALYKGVDKAFQKCHSLLLKNVQINVSPDADASKVMNSDKYTDIEIHKQKNEARLEIARKEQEELVLQSEHEVQKKKAEHLQQLAEVFGEIAPVAEEHLKGNMDGKEFYQYIKEKQERDLAILAKFKENEWISDRDASDTLLGIIKNSNVISKDEQLQIEGAEGKKIEQKTEENLHEDDWIKDGDSI